LISVFARLAHLAYEPLGADQVDRRRHKEGLDAHVDDSVDRARGVVRVQVERTRWPVNAAFVAIEAVSRSRISPTMMMLEILAEEGFEGGEKVSPTSS